MSPSKPARSAATPRFFATPAAWRKWLTANHHKHAELWVGFWRVTTGKPSITWPQSVDEALCFGWIDGQRRTLDAESYVIRFTPRKAESKWSRVNLKRYAELESEGRVRSAGKAARAKWEDSSRAGYSFETPGAGLDAASLARLNANPKARRFWEAQTPSYRKVAGHWATSAKREETRASRLATLIDCCVRGKAIPPIAKWVKVKQP
jgi:uncharacterized protein YdeI (YjbR/CyaY-like superfamily)